MNQHLRTAGRMARVGLYVGVFMLLSEAVDIWIRGEDPDWQNTLINAAIMLVLFALGGAVYSMILPLFTHGQLPPSGRAQLLAGASAGAAVGALLGVPLLFAAGLVGVSVILIGALCGAICGLLTPNHRRADPPPAS